MSSLALHTHLHPRRRRCIILLCSAMLTFFIPAHSAKLEIVDLDAGNQLGNCQGNCNNDDDCMEGLICIRRIGDIKKFRQAFADAGCSGKIKIDVQYCIDPGHPVNKQGNSPAQPDPTVKPTNTPTRVWAVKPDEKLPTASQTTTKPRSWTEVISAITLEALSDDPYAKMVATELDPFKFTVMPSTAPSSSPTYPPTAYPTKSPTFSPSQSPTVDLFPPNKPPKDPQLFYFDYDSKSKRGPKKWGEVENAKETKYWEGFQEWIVPNLKKNMCDSKSDRQSPIDVRFDKAKAQCFEYHEIRHKEGEFGIAHPNVKKQILPSKLRFVYPRRYDTNATWATENDFIRGPSADVPKRWGHQLPVTHVDIKIPSEHWMEGKQYAAEYQIFLIQNRDRMRGAPAVSILIDIHPENKPNRRFQQMIDEFQRVFIADNAECEAKRRRERRLDAAAYEREKKVFGQGRSGAGEDEEYSTWLDEPEEEEVKFQSNLRKLQTIAQMYGTWDPWHKDIMTSIWFYGYAGSITEPPCSEFVEWRVIDKPALISSYQLRQMKNILFNHVDGQCRRTSVHNKDHSVARPPQPLRGRELYRCMCRDFIADSDRAWYGNNRCLWKERDQFGVDKEQFTLEWYQETHPYETIEEMWNMTGTPVPDWA